MRVAAFITFGVALLLVARYTVPTNRVTVVNESGLRAEDVQIEVNGELTSLGELPPDTSASARFCTPRQEDVIQLRCRLAGGLKIGDSTWGEPCHYITYGDYFRRLVITIRADGSVSCE